MKLKKSIIFFRHGARTNVKDLMVVEDIVDSLGKSSFEKGKYSTSNINIEEIANIVIDDDSNPYESVREKPDSFMNGGCHYGELTTVGQDQAKQLGEWLRETYVIDKKLINSEYNPDQILLRSTKMRRTILTLLSLLDGMFTQNLLVKPKVVTRSWKTECLVPKWEGITEIKEYMKYVIQNRYSLFPHQKDLIQQLEKFTETNLDNTPMALVSLNDIIQCRKAHNMFIPEYLADFEEKISQSASEIFGKTFEGDQRSEKLWHSVGQILDELIEDFFSESSIKLFIYSAHDVTLLVLLMVFGHWNWKWPEFCSSLCIEIYENEVEEKYIRILYEKKMLMLLDNNEHVEFLELSKFLSDVEKYRWSKRFPQEQAD